MGETDTAAAKPGIPAARADQKSASPKSSIEQLSVQLLEQTEKNSTLENEMLKLKRYNEELLRRIHDSRKQQEDSDREVQKLSTEVEELSATLFDQANNKVKEANVQANDFKVRNGKLIESLKQKDMVIDVLKKELTQLKDMLTHLSSNQPNGNGDASSSLSEADKSSGNSVEDNNLGDASFTAASLQKFNGQLIYSPLYNQLRFDLQSFNQFRRALASTTKPFSIRDSSFFRTILAEDVEPVLRLDLSPAVKFYRRRSFIISLMDSKVTIEPLSAYTEVWKSNNLSQATLPAEKSASSSNKGLEQGVKPDPKLFRYDTDRPVAVEEKCSLCGEKRKEMNFARLYRLKIKDYAYTICISCANKLRCTVELLGYLKSLKQSVLMDEVASLWCKLTELRAKLYFTKFGLWSEADKFGLVYGWKNQWWNQEESQQFSGNMSEIPASSAASISGNDTTNESVNEENHENHEKNENNEKDGKNEKNEKNEKYENSENNEKSEKNKISGQQLENEAEKDLLSEEADTTISESKQNPVLEAKANKIAGSSIDESKKDKESKENSHNKGKMVEDSTDVKENVVVEDKAKAEEKSENENISDVQPASTNESDRKLSSESEDAFNDAVE